MGTHGVRDPSHAAGVAWDVWDPYCATSGTCCVRDPSHAAGVAWDVWDPY